MQKSILFLIILLSFKSYSQEQAIEIYSPKDSSRNFVIKIDDKVLIKCRNLQTGHKKLVVARLWKIDSTKFYFYPVNKNYRESIYTLSTLGEVGIKTTFYKVVSIVRYALIIKSFLNGEHPYICCEETRDYKMVNVKSRKWDVRLINY
jgi:hypothetical protein